MFSIKFYFQKKKKKQPEKVYTSYSYCDMNGAKTYKINYSYTKYRVQSVEKLHNLYYNIFNLVEKNIHIMNDREKVVGRFFFK